MPVSTEPAVAGGPDRVAIRHVWGPPRLRGDKIRKFVRTYRLDIAWAVFIVLNLLAMRLIPAWQTVPFLIIWISLTTIYGFRLWHLGSTMLTVAVVTLCTGGLIGWQVLRGKQDGDYLAEVPLLAAMFVVMVWHARRRQTALEEMKRVSEHNLLLLEPAASVPAGRLARAGHADHHRPRPRRAHHPRRHRSGHRQGRPRGRGRTAPDAPAGQPPGAPGLDGQPGLPAPGPRGRRRAGDRHPAPVEPDPAEVGAGHA